MPAFAGMTEFRTFYEFVNLLVITPSLQPVPPKSHPGLTKGDTPKLNEFESSHDGSPYFWVLDPKKGRLKMFDYGKINTPCQPVSGLDKGSKML